MLRYNISQNLTTFIATYYEKSFLINDTMLLFVNLKKKIVALLAMQIEKYIINNVRNEHFSRAYVQDIVRYTKIAKYASIYN